MNTKIFLLPGGSSIPSIHKGAHMETSKKCVFSHLPISHCHIYFQCKEYTGVAQYRHYMIYSPCVILNNYSLRKCWNRIESLQQHWKENNSLILIWESTGLFFDLASLAVTCFLDKCLNIWICLTYLVHVFKLNYLWFVCCCFRLYVPL